MDREAGSQLDSDQEQPLLMSSTLTNGSSSESDIEVFIPGDEPRGTFESSSLNPSYSSSYGSIHGSSDCKDSDTKIQGTARRPFRYHSPSASIGSSTGAGNVYQRYKYYCKLSPHDRKAFTIPNHVLPSKLFILRPPPGFSRGSSASKVGTQSSLVTILSIWNTMMGTSLLSMPWAIEQAGFAMGFVLMFLMGGLCLFTCHLIIKNDHGNGHRGRELDFGDICGIHLGSWANYLCVVFSVMTFVGAQIVFWVLMSNFMYHIGECILQGVYGDALGAATVWHTSLLWTSLWNLKTTPLFLLLPLFPLVNLKSLTFFTKFNALGIVGVLYMVFFVFYSVGVNGIHFNSSVTMFSSNFPALSGVLSLSFFIHNGVLSITRNAKTPKNNGRDLVIAYICVGLTYTFVGFGIFLSYPGDKNDLKSNFLDNFAVDNPAAVIARVFLLLQITTVFPLIMFIIRFQVMQLLFGKPYPNFGRVFILNCLVTTACVLFAIFMPHIGDIIRFTGSFCGVIVVFCLPPLLDFKIRKETGRITFLSTAGAIAISIIGIVNFGLQFTV